MNEVIEWLNSEEGIEWSSKNHHLVPTVLLVTFKDDGEINGSLINQAYKWEPLSDELKDVMLEHYYQTLRTVNQTVSA